MSDCATNRLRGGESGASRRVRTKKGGITWHDLALWEVAGEEIVIHGDILVGNAVLLGLQFEYPVYQQEGKPAPFPANELSRDLAEKVFG